MKIRKRSLVLVLILSLVSLNAAFAAKESACASYLNPNFSFERNMEIASRFIDRKTYPSQPKLNDFLKPGQLWLTTAEYDHYLAMARKHRLKDLEKELLSHRVQTLEEKFEETTTPRFEQLVKALEKHGMKTEKVEVLRHRIRYLEKFEAWWEGEIKYDAKQNLTERVDAAREILKTVNESREVIGVRKDGSGLPLLEIKHEVFSKEAINIAVITLAENGIDIKPSKILKGSNDSGLLLEFSSKFIEPEFLGLASIASKAGRKIKGSGIITSSGNKDFNRLLAEQFEGLSAREGVLLTERLKKWRFFMGPSHYDHLVNHYLDTNTTGVPMLAMIALAEAPADYTNSLRIEDFELTDDEVRLQKLIQTHFEIDSDKAEQTRERILKTVRKFLRETALDVKFNGVNTLALKLKGTEYSPLVLALRFLGKFGNPHQNDHLTLSQYQIFGITEPEISEAAILAELNMIGQYPVFFKEEKEKKKKNLY